LVVDEGATHMALEALPDAACTEVRGKMQHGGDKFINGRHCTSSHRRPTPPFLVGNCNFLLLLFLPEQVLIT
jgi:hypothetical protein